MAMFYDKYVIMPGGRPDKTTPKLIHHLHLSMPKPKSNALVVYGQGGNPQQQNPKPKKAKKPKKKAGQMRTPYMKLMLDPWTAETSNSSRPDMNQEPTLVWREKGADNITTDSYGNSWLQFSLSLNDFYYPATFSSATATAGLGAATDINNYTELSTTFTSFRPYALAVELEYIGTVDAAKGILFCATTNDLLNAPGTLVTSLVDENDYREISTGSGKVAVVKRFFDNDAFASVTGALNYAGLVPPVVVHVGGLGLPVSTQCLRVRYCYVSEYQVGLNKLMGHVTHRSPTNPVQIHAASNMAGPDASTAAGENPLDMILRHSSTLLDYGMRINGLWERAQQMGPLLIEMGAML